MLGLERCLDPYWLANRWTHSWAGSWAGEVYWNGGVAFSVPYYDARDNLTFKTANCYFQMKEDGTLNLWSWHLGLRPVIVLEKGAFSNATGGGTEENPIILHK